ncbi:YezD family protein [Alkalimonas sp.]|uniref:YezD family protein n=1 Tax=Alkalimonas sp. TaxID=1872453 RepID=UPI00263A967B|nr:YezD family protein [Alkalimonas sp.]MCC5827322.1 YezD family protein [Alkalimonas sp.]
MITSQQTAEQLADLAKRLELLVGRIEYGSIELIFHHGKLVQLEKNEKIRLDKPVI